jgi:dethiobiotin synthetase
VGKTLIAAALTGALREAGVRASYFKPVQSGGILQQGKIISPDLAFVRGVTVQEEDDLLLNPVCLQPPLAPSVAAELTGVTIDLDRIIQAYNLLVSRYEFVIVEGAGGLYVPLIGTKFLQPDLVKLMNLPVVVVARPGLGTINHTVLTVKSAENLGIEVIGVIINFSHKPENTPAEKTNPEIIEALTGRPILGIVPYLDGLVAANGPPSHLVEAIAQNVDMERICFTANISTGSCAWCKRCCRRAGLPWRADGSSIFPPITTWGWPIPGYFERKPENGCSALELLPPLHV